MARNTITPGTPVSPATTTNGYALYVLGMLVFANVFANIDRVAFTLVLETVRLDLRASDTEMGLLAGAVFTISYVLLGVPLARLADRGVRRSILAGSVAFWSVMTMACGLATSTWQMAFARAGLGMGEAGCIPTSISLIGDYFTRSKRPLAIGIFQAAAAVAAIFVAPLVGIITDAHGWRMAFFAVGAPGVALAIVIRFSIREPVRGAMEDQPQAADGAIPSTGLALRQLLASPTYSWLLSSQFVTGIGSGAVVGWMAVIFVRVHHLSYSQIGLAVGTVAGLGMLGGSVICGAIASRLVAHAQGRFWLAVLAMACAVLAAPMMIVMALSPSPTLAIVAGGLYYLFGFGRTVPALSLAMEVVSPQLRGLATSLMHMSGNLVGAAIGPLIIGLLSDRLARSLGPAEGLKQAFVAVGPVAMAVGAVITIMVMRSIRRENFSAA